MDVTFLLSVAGLLVALLGLAYVQTSQGRTFASDARRLVADSYARAIGRVRRRDVRRDAASTRNQAWTAHRDPILDRLGIDVRWIGHREDHVYVQSDVRLSHVPDHWGLPNGDGRLYLAKSVADLVSLSRGIDPDLARRSIELVRGRLRGLPADDRSFFNGPTVRLEGARPAPSGTDLRPGIEVFTSLSNYYTGWAGFELARSEHETARHEGLPSARWSGNIAVTGYLITIDGRIVYTRRSRFVARNAGKLGPTVSGDMSPVEDRTARGPSPFRAVARECAEEVGANIADLVGTPGWQLDGIAVDAGEEQPVFVFHAKVNATLRDIEAAEGSDRRFEHGGANSFPSFSMERDDLCNVAREVVAEAGDWEHVSIAALLMVLRRWHGSDEVDAAFRSAFGVGSKAAG